MISLRFLILLAVSYLIGAIPFAYIFVKALKGTDVRKIGSGNVGATNAARVLGRWMGILILVLDTLKGVVPTFFGAWIANGTLDMTTPKYQLVATCLGIAAFLGHCYNPFLRFKGGKGVATGLGVYLVLAPLAALVTLGVCLVIILVTRLVSLASVTGAILLPVLILVFSWRHPHPQWVVFGLTVVMGAMVILRHRSNIRRLLAGTESKS
jgi:glycerol-3-phosphate acyltransferase PlsY